MARIALIDYGAGNLTSVRKGLGAAGAAFFTPTAPGELSDAAAIVVPGVGHFGQCVRQFRAAGLQRLVRRWIAEERPLLGVCVGMQILYERSEEDLATPGLGVLPGTVRRLPDDVIVPHMGWNTVTAVRPDGLLGGVDGEQVYFVHSYAAEPTDGGHVVATTGYGPGFVSVVRAGTVVGTQFHPEKSGDVGARLLANWVCEVDGT